MVNSKQPFAPFNAKTVDNTLPASYVTTHIRKKIHAVMADMGLTLISTPRQIKNGTLMYRDPKTQCLYSFHQSGYCRRHTPNSNGTRYDMYQLNRTQYGTKTTTRHGREYTSYQKIRVLANPTEQLGIVAGAIALYRQRQNC